MSSRPKGKLRLDADDLQVESFEALPRTTSGSGTVKGHATDWTLCDCPDTQVECGYTVYAGCTMGQTFCQQDTCGGGGCGTGDTCGPSVCAPPMC